MPITNFILCSTRMIVRCRANSAISVIMLRVSSGLMPAVGSSSSSKTRVAGQRHGDLERALLAVGEGAGEAVPGRPEADGGEEGAGLLDQAGQARAGAPDVVARRQRLEREADVFQCAELGEDGGDLERFRDAELGVFVLREAGDVCAFEGDAAGGWRELAGERVEERALAGAVGADDARELAAA